VEQIQAWDARSRDVPGDAFAFWPAGTVPPAQPDGTAVFPKIHGIVTVSWPACSAGNPHTKD
jgi:protein-L-isoaspartate(D-aspartate) O-methyltransferase